MIKKDLENISPPQNVTTSPNPAATKKPRSHKGVLTRKQKAFADELMNNPKTTQREAYKTAFNVKPDTKVASIDVQASKMISKPQVISYLANYNNLVENTLLNTINDWGQEENTRKREIAVNTSMFIHDKIHGKAKQSIQTESKVVTISINLTGDNELPPADLA